REVHAPIIMVVVALLFVSGCDDKAVPTVPSEEKSTVPGVTTPSTAGTPEKATPPASTSPPVNSADNDTAKAAKDKGPEWNYLFDGKTLSGWEVTDFGGQGDVEVKDGAIVLEIGSDMTGVTWKRDFPRVNYEVSLEAKRINGNDFFCGVVFPVEKKQC